MKGSIPDNSHDEHEDNSIYMLSLCASLQVDIILQSVSFTCYFFEANS